MNRPHILTAFLVLLLLGTGALSVHFYRGNTEAQRRISSTRQDAITDVGDYLGEAQGLIEGALSDTGRPEYLLVAADNLGAVRRSLFYIGTLEGNRTKHIDVYDELLTIIRILDKTRAEMSRGNGLTPASQEELKQAAGRIAVVRQQFGLE